MSTPDVQVEPDVVRRAASLVAEAADLARRPGTSSGVSGLGTGELDAAATRLVTMLDTGTTVLGDALGDTARGLREAADRYAEQEEGAVDALRRLSAPPGQA